MQNKTKQSFVVVGGGVIGLTIALTLQARGVQVLLVDKDTIAAGTSLGNAGHIATEQVFPIADPSVLKSLPRMLLDPLGPLRLDWRYLLPITPWMLRLVSNMRPRAFAHIHQALTLINAAALPAWHTFTKQYQLEDLVKINGSLLVAEKPQTAVKLQQHGEALNRIGVTNSWLTTAELLEREPLLANNQLGALFYPNTGHLVDLAILFTRLQAQFFALGGAVLEHVNVRSIRQRGPDDIFIDSSHGPLLANNVVVACGAYAKNLVKGLSGVSVPLETERGYHLMLPAETARLSVPVSSADRRFIMTPMNNGLRLAGTVEYAGLTRPPNMQRARNLLPLANPMLRTALNAQGNTQWMGFRPTIADSLPVIDKYENCYYAFGHQHLGLTQAPITAELIAALHFGEATPIDCSAFSLSRFA
ncbi:FAD-dependent oxidoreductase [Rheinheimera metallidurans]|uniref:NAD(P)/FAD-dependent oxidoreductase n=1 Tax=Rheinheimera metallidurans TaxID=2925781 RepID=UPI0030010D11